ncbi:MAG: FAD-dependent oxidoreductase, partial [Candidatus Microthrix parvicella]
MERRQLLRMGATGGAWWATLATAGGCSSQRDAERNATRGSTSTRQPVPEPTAMVRTNWSKDPWARGSYSYLPVGATPELRRALGTPIDDRLFFAGEATDLGDPGTVHGARASGMR